MKRITPAGVCSDTPPTWFAGHWRDWHRGHGCNNDDGAPRSAEAVNQISVHAERGGTLASCLHNTPPWFTGRWRDWHRGHNCDKDDGQPRSAEAVAEIFQHEANEGTGYLTDAELAHLRARTTSGDTLLVRALDELKARRSEIAQRTAELVEALHIFNTTWCTEYGHSPNPAEFARIEELRISAVGKGAPPREDSSSK